MKLKFLIDEDMVNYMEPSMFVGFPYCSFKCEIDCGENICQNHHNYNSNFVDISVDDLCKRFLNNDLSRAIVFGGFEPFDSPFDLITFVDTLRTKYQDDSTIVIYTGYTEKELEEGKFEFDYGINIEKLKHTYNQLKTYGNIIIKYGRYKPNCETHFDPILGINLASDNQYAKYLKDNNEN